MGIVRKVRWIYMICSHCGADNPDDARKCARCGEPLKPGTEQSEKKKSSASSRIRKITVESVDSRSGFGRRGPSKNIPEGTAKPFTGAPQDDRGPTVEDTLDLSRFHLENEQLKEVNLEDTDFPENGPGVWGPSGEADMHGREMPEPRMKPARGGRGIRWIILGIAAVVVIAAVIIGILIWRPFGQDYADVILEGNRYYREANYGKAEEIYYKAVEMEPGEAEGYFCLAELYVALDDTEKAVEILSQGYERTGDAQLEQRIRELSGSIRPQADTEGSLAETGTPDTAEAPETSASDAGAKTAEGTVSWVLEPAIEAADIMPVPGCSVQEDIYSGNVSMLIRDGQTGLIDTAGNVVLEPQFQYILRCAGLLYGFRDDGSSVLINEDYTLNPDVTHEHDTVSYDYLWDDQQKAVFRIVHTPAGTIVEDTPYEVEAGTLVPVISGTVEAYTLENARYALAGADGLCTDFIYEDTGKRSWEGMMAVCLGGKWGFCSLEGTLVVPCEYDGAKYLGPVNSEAQSGYIQGAPYGYCEGYVAVKKDGKWGFLDQNGSAVLPFIFDEARPVQDGSAWVRYEGKWGRVLLSTQENENPASEKESGTAGQPSTTAPDSQQNKETEIPESKAPSNSADGASNSSDLTEGTSDAS